MNRTADRKKLRREYLKQKSRAYKKTAILVCLLIIGSLLIYTLMRLQDNSPIWFFIIAMYLLVFVGFVVTTGHQAYEAQQAARLAYIPPVTASTLPADEILVRGSEEPPLAQSEVLLRAATEQETPKEELLRVSQEG